MADMSAVKRRLRFKNEEAMQQMADQTVANMISQAPRGETERLVRGIGHSGVQETPTGLSVTFFSEAPYSDFVDEGTTGPYVIFPLAAKVLRFKDGTFSAHAVHPGNPRNGFFTDNLNAVPELLQEIVESTE